MQQPLLTPQQQQFLLWQAQEQLAAQAAYGPQAIFWEPTYAQQAQQAQQFTYEQPAVQSYATVPRLQFKRWVEEGT